MNTGVQRSSQTPGAARTATTMTVGDAPGNLFYTGKKVPTIAIAHEIPFVATASIHDLHDLEAKMKKAMSLRGARYVEIFVPCPLGWGAQPDDTIKIARLAVETGLYPLFEAERGEITGVKKIRRRRPVEDYLKLQRRFAHVFKPGNEWQLEELQAMADRNIRRYGLI
jgi:pyruvate ferredoxin oxidoreductase beta subunit